MIWHPVPGEELPQPNRVARVVGADHLGAASDLDQDLAPGHVGAEDHVRELLLVAQEPLEAVHGNVDHAPRVADDGAQVGAPSGQQVELAQEPAVAVHRDHPVLGSVAADDRDRA